MHAAIRKLGNSSGLINPKSMLTEIGIAAGDTVDLSLEGSRVTITAVKRRPRAGSAEASRAIAEAGEHILSRSFRPILASLWDSKATAT